MANFEELESTIGVPAPLLERAAAARAAADDKSDDAVVADWTGEAAPAPPPEAVADAAPPEAAAPEVVGPGALPSAQSLSGDALISAAAEAKGIPLSLVERSAQARADADGVSVEDVMRQWVLEAGLAAGAAR